MKELQYPVRPGRYRHFKGNEYQVLGVARHSETEEEMVVYRALYGEGGSLTELPENVPEQKPSPSRGKVARSAG